MSFASSPFGESSEFQEEEIHDAYDSGAGVPAATTSSAAAVAPLTVSNSSASNSSSPVSPSQSTTPSVSAVGHYAREANVTLPTVSSFTSAPLPPVKITNGTNAQAQSAQRAAAAANAAGAGGIGSTVPASFDEARASLSSLWSATTSPEAGTFSHSAYSTDKFNGHCQVNVTDPEKKGDGIIGAHITYKVISSLELAPSSVTQSTVFRRYNDFLWLHETLSVAPAYSGFLIPPIPDKGMIGRFGEDFVEDRRRGLELFLRRILTHPVLRHAEDVRTFLQANEQSFAVTRSAKKRPASSSAANPTGVVSFLKERVSDISSAFQSAKAHDRSPDDVACEKAADYAMALEHELIELHNQIEMMIKREKNVARNWIDFGLSASVLGAAEGENGDKSLHQVFALLASLSDQVAVQTAAKVEMERQGMRDVIKDHIRLSDAVEQMMKLRAHVSAQYYSALQTLEQRQNKASVKDAAANARLVAEAQQTVNQRQSELSDTTQRARVEFARFQKEKSRALKDAVRHFVKVQIAHAKVITASWEQMLPDLENIQ